MEGFGKKEILRGLGKTALLTFGMFLAQHGYGQTNPDGLPATHRGEKIGLLMDRETIYSADGITIVAMSENATEGITDQELEKWFKERIKPKVKEGKIKNGTIVNLPNQDGLVKVFLQ